MIKKSPEYQLKASAPRYVKIDTHKIDNPSPDEWFKVTYDPGVTITHVGWNGAEWLAHRLLSAGAMLPMCLEINIKKRHGVPVIIGTRITAAEVLAEIADGKRSVEQICQAFEIDEASVKTFVRALAIYLDRQFPQQANAYANISIGRELKRF